MSDRTAPAMATLANFAKRHAWFTCTVAICLIIFAIMMAARVSSYGHEQYRVEGMSGLRHCFLQDMGCLNSGNLLLLFPAQHRLNHNATTMIRFFMNMFPLQGELAMVLDSTICCPHHTVQPFRYQSPSVLSVIALSLLLIHEEWMSVSPSVYHTIGWLIVTTTTSESLSCSNL